MSKRRHSPADDFDESDLFSDLELNLDTFIDSMKAPSTRGSPKRRRSKPAWQRVDDWRGEKWLRDQLKDWEDWDEQSDE